MEGCRRRIDDIVEDPETAEKLKPWYGKHCKRLCFHDDYLARRSTSPTCTSSTPTAGACGEITADGPVVDGTEYPLDLLVFASGFEVTTGLVNRLGFDPVGRDGVTLSERWHDGAHTLHGVLTDELPEPAASPLHPGRASA